MAYKDKDKQREANRQAQQRRRELVRQGTKGSEGMTDAEIDKVYKGRQGTKEGHVYIVQCGNMPYYKVGVTQGQPSERVSSLQTGCPFELRLIEAFFSYNAEGLEKTIQESFDLNRVRGEWY